MKNKKGILITAVIVLSAVVIAAFASRTFGIGGFLTKVGRQYAATRANNKVVATVNGEPVYLSMVTLRYLAAKEGYSSQIPELKKHFPDSYKKLIKKPDPFNILNRNIDGILLRDYMRKKGIKVDSQYLQDLIKQQKKEFFYLINGLPKSETDKMTKTNIELYKEDSKIIRDIIKASGMRPDEFFRKVEIPGFEDQARMETLEEQLAKSVKAPKISENEIKNYMNLHKGITKSEAISALEKQKVQSIVNEKIKTIVLNLRKTADIKILDKDDLVKLAQDP